MLKMGYNNSTHLNDLFSFPQLLETTPCFVENGEKRIQIYVTVLALTYRLDL